jgi:hypothetical protein
MRALPAPVAIDSSVVVAGMDDRVLIMKIYSLRNVFAALAFGFIGLLANFLSA